MFNLQLLIKIQLFFHVLRYIDEYGRHIVVGHPKKWATCIFEGTSTKIITPANRKHPQLVR